MLSPAFVSRFVFVQFGRFRGIVGVKENNGNERAKGKEEVESFADICLPKRECSLRWVTAFPTGSY